MPDQQTVDALIRERATSDPAKPMVIDPDTRISYGELDAGTRTIAAGFIEAGVGKGTRVGLLMPNSCDWVRIALALNRIGAVLVPLSTLLTGRELAAQLRTAAVQYLIAVDEFRGNRYLDELPEHSLPALRGVWTPAQAMALSRDRVGDDLTDAAAAAVTPSDILVIIFTSGSSGPPKGVLHSHGSALAAVQSGLECSLRPNRQPAVPADAVLLGGRFRRRDPDNTGRRCHAGDRTRARTGGDVAAAGA